MKIKLALFFKGIAMGAADIVPGVSGGTIALITGIYEELIDSIKNISFRLFKILFTDGFKSFWKDLNGNFLLTLASGILLSILLLAQFISYLLVNHEFKIWGFFFGLILCSGLFSTIGNPISPCLPTSGSIGISPKKSLSNSFAVL